MSCGSLLTSPLVSAALFPPSPSCPALPERAARPCPSAHALWWPRNLWRCCWEATSGPSWWTCRPFCRSLGPLSKAPGVGTHIETHVWTKPNWFCRILRRTAAAGKHARSFVSIWGSHGQNKRPFMSSNGRFTTGAQTLTIWQRHLFSLTSFSSERFSMMSASASAPSWSCLLASLKEKRVCFEKMKSDIEQPSPVAGIAWHKTLC